MINILELESSLGFGGQEHRTQRVINGLDKSKFKVFYGLNPGSKSLEKQTELQTPTTLVLRLYGKGDVIGSCKCLVRTTLTPQILPTIAPIVPSLPE